MQTIERILRIEGSGGSWATDWGETADTPEIAIGIRARLRFDLRQAITDDESGTLLRKQRQSAGALLPRTRKLPAIRCRQFWTMRPEQPTNRCHNLLPERNNRPPTFVEIQQNCLLTNSANMRGEVMGLHFAKGGLWLSALFHFRKLMFQKCFTGESVVRWQ